MAKKEKMLVCNVCGEFVGKCGLDVCPICGHDLSLAIVQDEEENDDA